MIVSAVVAFALVKFGLMFANGGPFAEPGVAIGFARAAEAAGFESVWTVEHVVVPTGYESTYPYSPTGTHARPARTSPIPDPLIWLAYVAAATSTIRLGDRHLDPPATQPGGSRQGDRRRSTSCRAGASSSASASAGSRRSSTRSASRSRTEGSAPTNTSRCYAGCGPSRNHVEGEFTRFAALQSYPKPATAEGPKIHIGGHTAAAARRAGRLGDGFFPGRGEHDGLLPLLDDIRAAAKEAGRDSDAIEVSSGGGLDLDTVKRSRTSASPVSSSRRWASTSTRSVRSSAGSPTPSSPTPAERAVSATIGDRFGCRVSPKHVVTECSRRRRGCAARRTCRWRYCSRGRHRAGARFPSRRRRGAGTPDCLRRTRRGSP